MKLARPSRSSLARLVARTLIAALLLALIPPEVRASIPSPNDTRAHPDLSLASSASHAVLLVVAVAKDQACAVAFAAADPHFFGIVWDFENRLTRVTKLDGTVVEHVYDADGNRVQTKTTPPGGPTATTNFLVDTSGGLSHAVAETDEAGALKAYYVRGDDLLAVMRPLVPAPTTPADWQTRFVHADGLGSIRRLTDENGLITDGYSYSAFGELLAHTGTDPQPYAFAGEPYDPNVGFQYHRARWMDPRSGRFVGMDPFGGSAFDPPSLHRYTYVHNDPPNGVDPTGLVGDFSIAGLSIAIGVSATIHGISAYQQDGSWYGVAAAVFEGAFEGAVFYTLFATGAVVVSAAGRLLRFLPALWNAGKVYPRGFTSFAQFRSFGRALQQGLSRGGHPEAKAAFQGSSVTGRSFGTGQPFDVGRISDFDIALGSPQLLARARAAGVALRSAGTRTGPLTEYELQQLGLAELRAELSRQAGREVNFMIFESIEAAVARGASMGVSF